MSQSSPLADVDRARLEQAYPGIFRPSPLKRMQTVAIIARCVGLFLFGMVWLDFSFEKLATGISRLGVILGLMFPPTPGHLLPLYLNGLAETLAIALLGTLLAAVIAFPLAFIAAKNVVAQRSHSFPVAPLSRYDTRCRYVDLGADLHQCGRAWTIRRNSGGRDVRHWFIRQAVLGGHRDGRHQAD